MKAPGQDSGAFGLGAIQRFPAEGLTVIVLCNRADLAAPELALKVADLYLAPTKGTPKN